MRNRTRWWDALLPDEVTEARMRRSILDAARPLLGNHRDSVWDVASNWATLLTPVAAALTLIFAGLALRESIPEASRSRTTVSADVVESLGSDAAPAGFALEEFDDADVVFAALGEVEAPVEKEPTGSFWNPGH
jgi:hypothetical protein